MLQLFYANTLTEKVSDMKLIIKLIIFGLFFTITGIFPIYLYVLSCESSDAMCLSAAFFVNYVLTCAVLILILLAFSKNLKLKKYLVILFKCNIFWWLIYIIVGIPFSLHYQQINEQKLLEPYKKVVSEIINYKKINNKYPINLENLQIPANIDPTKLDYKTFNNNNDFYFSSSKRDFEVKFIYCTTENTDFYCKTQKTREATISDIGDGWLKYKHDLI